MPFRKKNNITVVCEGTTENNYLSGLKRHINSTLNIVTTNSDAGDYTSVLRKLKQHHH